MSALQNRIATIAIEKWQIANYGPETHALHANRFQLNGKPMSAAVHSVFALNFLFFPVIRYDFDFIFFLLHFL